MKTTSWTDKATELKPEWFDAVNTCLVLAPHPDDESLGCGGLISLLRNKEKEVFVLFITDGSLSHPNSKKYPAEKLAALRKEEALLALDKLQVPRAGAFFFNKKDGSLPADGELQFEQNANQLSVLITLLHADLLLIPYEKDPHRDHRATAQMMKAATKYIYHPFQVLQYVIWLHERGEDGDMPADNALRYVDITGFLSQKNEAIQQHQSQITNLIDDDPEGFILSPEVLSHFAGTKEYYIDQPL